MLLYRACTQHAELENAAVESLTTRRTARPRSKSEMNPEQTSSWSSKSGPHREVFSTDFHRPDPHRARGTCLSSEEPGKRYIGCASTRHAVSVTYVVACQLSGPGFSRGNHRVPQQRLQRGNVRYMKVTQNATVGRTLTLLVFSPFVPRFFRNAPFSLRRRTLPPCVRARCRSSPRFRSSR